MDLPPAKVVDTVRFPVPAVDPSRIDHRNIFYVVISAEGPIPVAARSKAWVCGRSLAGVAGLNPARGMDVCLL
jgi:hypothetical protein